MIKTGYILLALALSFLIVGPVYGWGGADRDFDDIVDRKDICPDESFWGDNGYHRNCLQQAGLLIPKDSDFKTAQDEFLSDLNALIPGSVEVNFSFPTLERTWLSVNIKTCGVFGGLKGYKWSMDFHSGYYRTLSRLRTVVSWLQVFMTGASGNPAGMVGAALGVLQSELFDKYADIYKEFSNNAVNVGGTLCQWDVNKGAPIFKN